MDRNSTSRDQSAQFRQWINDAPPEQVAAATKAVLGKVSTYSGGADRDAFASALGHDRDVETGIAKLREFSTISA